jgi:hypothetical protein
MPTDGDSSAFESPHPKACARPAIVPESSNVERVGCHVEATLEDGVDAFSKVQMDVFERGAESAHCGLQRLKRAMTVLPNNALAQSLQ